MILASAFFTKLLSKYFVPVSEIFFCWPAAFFPKIPPTKSDLDLACLDPSPPRWDWLLVNEFFDTKECLEISDFLVRREVVEKVDLWDWGAVGWADWGGVGVGIWVCFVAVIGLREDWGLGLG